MPTMVFHAPYPLNRQATSASGIRPVRMRDAFEEIGYTIIEVTGSASERREGIRMLATDLREGLQVDFLYSESATIPTALTEPSHLPPHLFLDRSLFRMCQQYSIPTSLFYRDIYWAFPTYDKQVGRPLAAAMRMLYRYDLRWYARYVDLLYLPSLKMGKYVPEYPQRQMRALPPGSVMTDADESYEGRILQLLYIGGLNEHYQLHELLRAVAETEGVSLTICTREQEWQAARGMYESLLNDSIRVVHRSGEGLRELYEDADICSLYVKPDEYRTFASPVKLYEYIGYGKPVLASEGTFAARFVEENRCGWVLPYDATVCRDFLQQLILAPEKLAEVKESTRQARTDHTWQARAQQVAEESRRIDKRASDV